MSKTKFVEPDDINILKSYFENQNRKWSFSFQIENLEKRIAKFDQLLDELNAKMEYVTDEGRKKYSVTLEYEHLRFAISQLENVRKAIDEDDCEKVFVHSLWCGDAIAHCYNECSKKYFQQNSGLERRKLIVQAFRRLRDRNGIDPTNYELVYFLTTEFGCNEDADPSKFVFPDGTKMTLESLRKKMSDYNLNADTKFTNALKRLSNPR